MEIARWVILILLVGLVTWLLIDTIIVCSKKLKARKKAQLEKQEQENKQIDENDSK